MEAKKVMSVIRALPQDVIEAIAAGEVAERPAIMVKELVENALDAQATDIRVELHKSGLDKIVVIDNGIGMGPEDLNLAYQRFTTSKIHEYEDLGCITTLGFRGEALASIAHASHLTLSSRTIDTEVGHRVNITDGVASAIKPVSHTIGTVAIVDHIFQHTPVRKKFLKHAPAELKKTIDYIVGLSLSQPQVGFSVFNDGHSVLNLPAYQNLTQRVVTLFSQSEADTISVFSEQPSLKISGLLGKPQIASRNSPQFLFINDRRITHPGLNKIIKNAFGTLLENKVQPFFILKLDLQPSEVDSNVHPHKETANLSQEKEVQQIVYQALRQSLEMSDLTFSFSETTSMGSAPSGSAYPGFKTQVMKPTLGALVKTWQPGNTHAEIIQVANTYLVVETSAGVLLLDQHAAHERILYEQFSQEIAQSNFLHTKTELLKPLTISVSQFEIASFQEKKTALESLGFVVAEFGKNTFVLNTVPKLFSEVPASELLEIVTILFQNELEDLANLPQITHTLLARLACRSAIKAGEFLTIPQRYELLQKLSRTPNQFTCPHGRPTTISFDFPTLEKMFKRRK